MVGIAFENSFLRISKGMIQHNDIEGTGNAAICHITDMIDISLAPVELGFASGESCESGGSGTFSALRKSYQIVVEILSHDTEAWRWVRSDN